MNIGRKEIDCYLSEVKKAVKNGKYRLERNDRRQYNQDLFFNYVLDEQKVRKIILDLSVEDFSEVLQNKHKGYEYERLYVFGKDVTLLERFGSREKTVSLYIKFNKLENCFVIVVSFHEKRYPIKYYFK